MAINFPNVPTNLEEYTDPNTGVKYIYNSLTDSWTGESANSTIFADLTTTQTIDGSKIFVQDIVGDVTGNAGSVTDGVYQNGDQEIRGTKTFSSTIVGNISGNAATATTATTSINTTNATNADNSTNCSRTISASNGLTGGGELNANRTISGVNATTSAKGVVQLSTSTSSTSTTQAATPSAVKTAFERAADYAPSKTGLNASGTWPINVTGNANSSDNCNVTISASNGLTGGGVLTANRTISGVDATTSRKGVVQLNSTFTSTSTTQAATPSAVKTAFERAADYAPSKTGSGASGTWGINITGNAATVTNGVYTSGNQTIAGTKTFSSTIVGNISGNASTSSTATNASNAALLDGIDSSQFLRSDATDVKTAGTLTFNDDITLGFGNSLDARFFKNGNYLYLDLAEDLIGGGFKIRKAAVDKYIFDATGALTTAGDLTAGGKVTSGSRFVAAKSTGSNVAYQQLDNSNSGFGFPNNDDVAIYSSGNKTLVATSDKSLLLGAGSSTGLNPGGTGSNWGIYMNSSGQVTHKRDSGINSGYCFKTGGESGALEVRNDGDCLNTNGRYEQGSDVRIKDNVIDAKSQWEDIKALRWVNYNYKPETNMPQHTQLGIVAQEAEDVCPGLISEGEVENTNWNEELKAEVGESYKTVAYSIIAMKSAAALKEAMIRIEELEAKMEALENK